MVQMETRRRKRGEKHGVNFSLTLTQRIIPLNQQADGGKTAKSLFHNLFERPIFLLYREVLG